MGPYKYFFDVPVYRLPEGKYYRERDAHTKAVMGDEFPNIEISRRPNESEARRINFLDHLQLAYGGPWVFNEIIGFIRLHFLGSQIRGEYFSTSTKRVVRTRRKIFQFQTHKLAPEVSFPHNASNIEIWGFIQEYLRDCAKEVNPRFVDVSMIEVIGAHMDWRSLLK